VFRVLWAGGSYFLVPEEFLQGTFQLLRLPSLVDCWVSIGRPVEGCGGLRF
jgi:hypothetical protein